MTSEGWVLIIAATGLALTQVITAWRTNQAVVETKALSLKAVEKLDVVTELGDGMRTELLDRIAALEKMLSVRSGNTIRADDAQHAAAQHRAVTQEAKEVD